MGENKLNKSILCSYCGKEILLCTLENVVQYYPEILHECECGTIVNEEGIDKTEEYYE